MANAFNRIISAKHLNYLIKNKDVLYTEKDCQLRFTNVNDKWLYSANFKNKHEALGLTNRECIWAEFSHIYEQYDMDILSGQAYGTVHPMIIENTRHCWVHGYRWPKYGKNGEIIGVNAASYEVDHNTYVALCLLAKKNRFGIEKFSIDKPIKDNLTSREKEMLFYLCHGRTAKRIGLLLNISYRTVELHIEHLKAKLNCRTKEELIEYAISAHYITILPGHIFDNSQHQGSLQTGLYHFLSGLLNE